MTQPRETSTLGRLARRALHAVGLTLTADVIDAAVRESQEDAPLVLSVLYRMDRRREDR